MRTQDEEVGGGAKIKYTHKFQRSGRCGKRGKQKSSPFKEELRKLMFACGDSDAPHEGTLDLLETYAEEFIVNLLLQA